MNASESYSLYRRAISGEELPVAFVDMARLEQNLERLVEPLARTRKTLRVATKSLRSISLLQRILERGGANVRGLMCFSVKEAHFLASRGFDDLLVAYPTAQPALLDLAAEVNARGTRLSVTADDPAHLEAAASAARRRSTKIPVTIDIDVSYRPIGDLLAIGVRRSPLHTPRAVADLVERLLRYPELSFAGLVAYEAHVAGVQDDSQAGGVGDLAKRAMKRLAAPQARERRGEIVRELERRGIAVPLFNGGGTGSVESSSLDDALTEVSVGSGFLDSHLFDGYRGLGLAPAAYFALEVTRIPSEGFVTCQGGGFAASGAAGKDRLPRPALPRGLALTDLEGAGEVQTPLRVPPRLKLTIGDPVFFRHAKAGELAEHFREYLLLRGDRVEARALTYRGEGQCFA